MQIGSCSQFNIPFQSVSQPSYSPTSKVVMLLPIEACATSYPWGRQRHSESILLQLSVPKRLFLYLGLQVCWAADTVAYRDSLFCWFLVMWVAHFWVINVEARLVQCYLQGVIEITHNLLRDQSNTTLFYETENEIREKNMLPHTNPKKEIGYLVWGNKKGFSCGSPESLLVFVLFYLFFVYICFLKLLLTCRPIKNFIQEWSLHFAVHQHSIISNIV